MSLARRSPAFFFFNDTATTEIYTLSLHDALPISTVAPTISGPSRRGTRYAPGAQRTCERSGDAGSRSEEHTSELQSRPHLVCRLLLEKKNKKKCKSRLSRTNKPRHIQ